MAKADIKWPSEDEDFDVTTGAEADKENADNTNTETGKAVDNSNAELTTEVQNAPSEEKVDDKPDEKPEEEPDNSEEETAEAKLDQNGLGSETDTDKSSEDTSAEKPVDEKPEEETKEVASEPEKSDEEQPESDKSFAEAESTSGVSTPSVKDSAVTSKIKGASLTKRFVFEVILIVLVAGLGLWAWQLHSANNDLQSQLNRAKENPQALIQRQNQELATKVAKLAQLSSVGDTPTIINVNDANTAKQKSNFYANAQNGDKVLVYPKAAKAILYRPSTNKIILELNLTSAANSTTTTTPAAAQ